MCGCVGTDCERYRGPFMYSRKVILTKTLENFNSLFNLNVRYLFVTLLSQGIARVTYWM